MSIFILEIPCFLLLENLLFDLNRIDLSIPILLKNHSSIYLMEWKALLYSNLLRTRKKKIVRFFYLMRKLEEGDF
jgi:hypothetical protein